jgi:protein-S-isoprenylcysteine O-methyltransferase Ste14
MQTLALLWIGWCVLHSLLITGRLNEWLQQRGGLLQGSYRIFYIIFSCLSLIPVLWYQYSLSQQLIFAWSGWWRILQIILLLYGLITFYAGKQVYDMDYFFGISQWRNYRGGGQPQQLPFVSQGILCYVRHPWYSGGLAFLWALGSLTDVSLTVRLILTVYVVIGALLEEKKLVRELGSSYREYCRQVPMLIPWRGRVAVDYGGSGDGGS